MEKIIFRIAQIFSAEYTILPRKRTLKTGVINKRKPQIKLYRAFANLLSFFSFYTDYDATK